MFRKSSPKSNQAPFPGKVTLLEGQQAIHQTEVALGCDPALAGSSQKAIAAALTGKRTYAVISSGDLLEKSAAPLPAVIHLACGSGNAPAFQEGHDAYTRSGNQGYFKFFAKDVQEMVDLTLIARRVTELSLIPGIVAHDTRQSGLSLQRVRMPEPELIRRYIGSPDEEIDPPTEAQKKVFGEKRARVPHLMDPALPLGIGVVHQQHRLRSVAAENFYWQAHLPGIIQKAMVEFGELTGREYAQLSHHNAEKADYVVITQGALVNDLLDFAAAVT
nr:hypothetical protein [Calditrichia bacterium]